MPKFLSKVIPSMRILFIFATAALIFSAFQNCGKSNGTLGSGNDQDPNSKPYPEFVAIGSTSEFVEVHFTPGQQISGTNLTTKNSLSLDIDKNLLEITRKGKSLSACSLDENRANKIAALLSKSKICEPGPLDPGVPVCMALAMSDIELIAKNGSSKLLAPIMCHNGTVLCTKNVDSETFDTANDSHFRDILRDIIQNPPPECLKN